jgi:immune inhibitor A
VKTRTLSLILLLPLCLLMSTGASAMPPHPDLLRKIRSGEVPMPYYLQHYREIRSRGVESASRPGALDQPRHHTLDEDLNMIVILVDFTDHGANTEPVTFDSLLFGEHTGTVRDYYEHASYGNLTLVTLNMPSALGWQQAPHSYSYYVDGQNGFGSYPHNAQRLAEDAVNLVNPYVDFSQYDNDGDGYVDALFIVHTGPGAELTGNDNDIWSHKWQMHTPATVDGVVASVYSMEPEFWQHAGDMTCGVYAHEMGHAVFGLPDLYDYDYDSEGLGKWSLMAGGSWNGALGATPSCPDAWSKVFMGFVTPTILTSNLPNASIPQVEVEPVIYRLWTDGMQSNEYFLVENRQQTLYDQAIPGNGLVVYHVDDAVGGNDNQWYPGYTTNGHYQVALEQSDGRWDIERNLNSGDIADPYPGLNGQHIINTNTVPGTTDYNFNDTHVSVRHITASSEVMHAGLFVSSTNNPVFVSSPDTAVTTGSTISIPVNVENSLTGRNVTSLHLSIQFDSALISADSPYFDISNSVIPASWTISPTHTASTLTINATGSSPLTGYGRLLGVRLHTSVTAPNNSTTLFMFTDCTFNQGTPAADTTNGRIRLVAPVPNYYPTAINLGVARVGSSILYGAFVVRNLGSADLIIDSVHVPDFVTTDFQAPRIVPPIQWTPVNLIFAPAVEGLFADSIHIYSNTSGSPRTIPITGRGALPRLESSASAINFDSVEVGHPSDLTMTLSDTGYWPTLVSQMHFAVGDAFQFSPAPQMPDTVPSRGSKSYVIRFNAPLGLVRDTLIVANDAGADMRIVLSGTGVELDAGKRDREIPTEFALRGNYPNPFNPSTTINYDVPRNSWVTLTVYDVLGRAVDVPLSGVVQPGRYSLTWSCPDCGSGIYFFVMSAEGKRFTQKAMLLR